MSGTSLDGVDLIYVKINRNNGYYFDIIKNLSVDYSDKWKKLLQDAFVFSDKKIKEIDIDYGKFLGKLINNFIDVNNIKKIDFISSHGHTIFHKPDQGYTLQIGNGAEIAKVTNCKVICDFRSQDVALGGQGAPLVPIGDMLLFSEFNYCLNLGGFANISFQKNNQRIAFDICPVNIVLNHYTRTIGFEYDDKGELASLGDLHNKLFSELNDLPFYRNNNPKSLGYEFIDETILPIINKYKLSVKDILRTFVEHAAYQISEVIKSNRLPNSKTNNNMLVTGGGAFNNFLIQRIDALAEADIVIPEKDIIEFKEALVFALLGVLKAEDEVNCLKSVTGATKDHSSGLVFYS